LTYESIRKDLLEKIFIGEEPIIHVNQPTYIVDNLKANHEVNYMKLCHKHGECIAYEGKTCPACEDVNEVKQHLEIAIAEKVIAEEGEIEAHKTQKILERRIEYYRTHYTFDLGIILKKMQTGTHKYESRCKTGSMYITIYEEKGLPHSILLMDIQLKDNIDKGL
jgi:hypothetical protein